MKLLEEAEIVCFASLVLLDRIHACYNRSCMPQQSLPHSMRAAVFHVQFPPAE